MCVFSLRSQIDLIMLIKLVYLYTYNMHASVCVCECLLDGY